MKLRKKGRPGHKLKAGERVALGLRVTPRLKRRLDAAVLASGRSQSQEAELRLERSFRDEEITAKLDEVLAELRKWRPV